MLVHFLHQHLENCCTQHYENDLVHLRCCWSDVRVCFSSHVANYYWSGDFWCLFESDICSLFWPAPWMVYLFICFLSFLTMLRHVH
jgi:hypothetical protein